MAMHEPARQLILDIAPEPRFEDEDFLVSRSNAAAYGAIESWPAWPGGALVLVGPPGAGKSHLGAIWARRAGAAIVPAAAFAEADPPALAARRHVLVEDAERFGQHQAGLFHLLNLIGEANGSTLLTANAPPDRWGIGVPDLLSRLRRATIAEIARPDDDLIRAVLVKLLVERQLTVDINVIDFVIPRIEPTLDAVRRLVEALDGEALSRGRRITRPIAAEVLATFEAGHEE
jgi:chromosomal replication initiation ATPase DnaA